MAVLGKMEVSPFFFWPPAGGEGDRPRLLPLPLGEVEEVDGCAMGHGGSPFSLEQPSSSSASPGGSGGRRWLF